MVLALVPLRSSATAVCSRPRPRCPSRLPGASSPDCVAPLPSQSSVHGRPHLCYIRRVWKDVQCIAPEGARRPEGRKG